MCVCVCVCVCMCVFLYTYNNAHAHVNRTSACSCCLYSNKTYADFVLFVLFEQGSDSTQRFTLIDFVGVLSDDCEVISPVM